MSRTPRKVTTYENMRFACQYMTKGARAEKRFATKKGAQNYANLINTGHFRAWDATNAIAVDLVGLKKLAAEIRVDVLGLAS